MKWLCYCSAAGAILGLFAVWRMPLPLIVRSIGAAFFLVLAGLFIFCGLAPSGTVLAALIFDTLAIGAMAALFVVVRFWLSDRAEIARLRNIAQRNADQISVVSHEIRTPLALIRGASDLLAERSPGPLTDSQARFVRTISGNCHAVIALAEDLLTQARIDAGMFELHLHRVNLRTLAAEVLAEHRQLHDMQFALDCPGAPPRVWADGALIRQAMTNLINNAVAHATNTKLITLRIVNADDQVLVSVSDDGEGMDEARRRELFKRFSSGRPLQDGTGLGLVITRQIVQMHGGDVFVDSTPGRGTTMLFSLPEQSPERVLSRAAAGAS
ncbi:sensor histidine kinase [Arthrobacter yangruifuii]|uniref:histidine kinase n=1 Tax=Arthrobacter yangruifuii TaxID=2606616 RepID=A0A5N6MGQ3_9MICC|nr:HAMP domain-containing sensor histidine kinase [Arthrobacter yangruifuii]KAD3455981.1 sensor histidine kinase [Arthrobacter yangruifuii]